jgi:energy-converting hydrogenase A subunit M
MSDDSAPEPDWLDEFRDLANRKLGDGSSCEQIHPIVERWFRGLMEGEPPESRDSVIQAMSCLSTEVLYSLPDDILNPLLEALPEDDLALWIEHVLLVGRAFEQALQKGELDDL